MSNSEPEEAPASAVDSPPTGHRRSEIRHATFVAIADTSDHEWPLPRPAESRARWMARVRRCASDGAHLDAVIRPRGDLFLDAAWDAAGRGNEERASAYVESALELLSIATLWGSDEGMRRYELPGLESVWFRIMESELDVTRVGAGRALRVFHVRGGFVLDDGRYQEGFERGDLAEQAVGKWNTRARKPGRGLPFVDAEEQQADRVWEAGFDATPLESLIALADDPHDEVVEALAERDVLPVEVIRAMRRGAYSDLRLARRKDLPAEVVDAIVADGNEYCIANLALAGYETDGIVGTLEMDPDAREHVACNMPHEPPYGLGPRILAVLAQFLA